MINTLIDSGLFGSRYSPYLSYLLITILCAASFSILTLMIPLSDLPVMEDFVNTSLSLMGVPDLGRDSSFPDASRMYFTFSVPIIYAFFGLMWRWVQSKDGNASSGILFIKKENMKIFHRLGLIILTPLWAVIAAGGWFGFMGGGFTVISFWKFHFGPDITRLGLSCWNCGLSCPCYRKH